MDASLRLVSYPRFESAIGIVQFRRSIQTEFSDAGYDNSARATTLFPPVREMLEPIRLFRPQRFCRVEPNSPSQRKEGSNERNDA
jgi:hypothetical protein